MTWRRRRRGIFEGLPRVLYRRTGARYIDAIAAGFVGNGLAVAGFGVLVLLLFVDVHGGELAAFAACSALFYVAENALAAVYLRSDAMPVRAWLGGERGDAPAHHAWLAVAMLPVGLLRRPILYVIGAAGAAASGLVLAALLGLPAYQAAWLFPVSFLLYVSSVVLRYLALELSMRPLLETIGADAPVTSPLDFPRASLHSRLLTTVPMINWGAGIAVAGLLTANTRDLGTIGLAGVVSLGVTVAVSLWLSLVLADAVSGPIIDLRDATRRVGGGDLAVRVPVVSTDETGELAASFNAMVAGLGERERLHAAFGTFVDPALTERVLAEGTDLRGEEIEASVLFLDVRDFTAFAEHAPAHEVVASLNDLFEAVVPVVVQHGGHANKFIGDGLLAVFGALDRHPDHAARAVATARDIAHLVRAGTAGHLRVGIGVNSGRVVAGTVGGGSRREFTVIGDAVNTAARVEAATRLTGDDILVTETTLHALGPLADQFEERSAVPLKGKARDVLLYALRAGGAGAPSGAARATR
jgi:adenylate cyclase